MAWTAYDVFSERANTFRGRIIPALPAPVRNLADEAIVECGSPCEYSNCKSFDGILLDKAADRTPGAS
jgi:hypothetical protein